MFSKKSLLGLALVLCAVPASSANADFRLSVGIGSNNGYNPGYGQGYGAGYGYGQSFYQGQGRGHHHHDPYCRPGYNASQYYAPRPAYAAPAYGIPYVPTPSYYTPGYTPNPYWRR